MARPFERLSALTGRLASLIPSSQPSYRDNLPERRAQAQQLARRKAYNIQTAGRQLSHVFDPMTAGVTNSKHPILQLRDRMHSAGIEHDAQLLVFHVMRQYIPTLDAAIRNRRTLEGDAQILSEDEGLAKEMNDWMRTVPVGYVSGRATYRGLNTYANLMAENADEYGLSAGEIQTDEFGREITRLVVPNARTLSLRDDNNDGIYELWQWQRPTGQLRRIDDSQLVQTLSFAPSAEGSWPYPMAWSLVKSTEALLRIYESVINGWWRFGDPSLMIGINYKNPEANFATTTISQGESDGETEGTSVEVPTALYLIKESLEAVMAARRSGKVADLYVHSDAGGEIFQEVIGEIDATLMRWFREQAGYFDGQIVAHSDTPPWMYPHLESKGDGLGSSRSNSQGLIASVAAHKRNEMKLPLTQEVLDTHLLLSGDARWIGRYTIDFDMVSILDEKMIQDTRKLEAEADSRIIENSFQLFNDTSETSEDGSMRMSEDQEAYLREKGVII